MAYTITYAFYSASGVVTTGTTPPTVAQSLLANRLAAVIACADADTATLITHNWNLSTNELSALEPDIIFYATTIGTAIPLVNFALTNSVAITMTKTSLAGSGGTFNIVLYRPHTIQK